MKTLFLHPPSFDGFDGGAGARYQMKREVRSFWYPTWLAQPAALVEGSKLIDAPPHGLKFEDIVPEIKSRDLVVMHTSTPVLQIGREDGRDDQGGQSATSRSASSAPRSRSSRRRACIAGARGRFRRPQRIRLHHQGSRRRRGRGARSRACPTAIRAGSIVHNENRAVLENMDALPWVTPVYKRDLTIENYFGGYLMHPYISFYTGRGCKSRCTFCLWPQTVGGHRYRVRSVENVVAEMKWAKEAFPQVKEFFFDDDTLTDNLPRVEALAQGAGQARRHLVVQRQGQCSAQDAGGDEGQRPAAAAGRLRIRQPADPVQHQEGHAGGVRPALHQGLPRARHRHPRHLHSGPAGRDRETIQETLDFAKEINPHTIQVSLAAPYPGTFLYRQAKENGWLYNEEIDLLTQEGTQIAPLNYPHLSHSEIFNSVEEFYRKFYFRPSKIAAIVAEMIASPRDDEAPLARGRGVLPASCAAAGSTWLEAADRHGG